MNLRLATGPVSWGVDFARAPENPPWTRVLDEIAASGFTHTELGPVGYVPTERDELRAAISSRGLAVGGSFLFQPLHDAELRAQVLEVARRTCAVIADAGGSFLIVLDLVSDERAATAGRSDVAVRLDEARWSEFVGSVSQVARIAVEEYGLRPVYHPHAGSYVEFEDEIERLMASDPIELCLDTGHSAYAGIDPVALYERYAARVPYLHLKDIDPATLRDVTDRGLDFWAAIAAGVFVPLGTGVVDFPALAQALELHEFDGWATVEQDRIPGSGAPLDDVIASRRYLERIGLVEVGRSA